MRTLLERPGVVLGGAMVLGAGAGLAVLRAPPIAAWLAAGVLAVCAAAAHESTRRLLAGRSLQVRGRSVALEPVAAELAAVALLAVLTCLILPGVILGDRPVAKDHTYHFMKALETLRLLQTGEILGWSSRFFAGYPHNVLYPAGADLLVVGIHLSTFGLVSMSASYALAVWLTVFGGAYAAFRFGAAAFDRRVGLVAAAAVLLDGGSFDQAGYSFIMGWGVWPQSLAAALSVLAASRLPAVIDGRNLRPLAGFALLTGGAILCHPLQLPFTALLVAAATLAWLLSRDVERSAAPPVRLGVSALAGVLLACFWLIPFATLGDQAFAYGKAWLPSPAIASGLLDGSAMPGVAPLVLACGLVGVAALLLAGRFMPLLTGLLALAPLVAAAGDVLASLGVLGPGTSPSRLQFERFVILSKPFLYVASAFALFAVLDRARAGATVAWRRYVRTLVVVSLAAPLLLPAAARIARERLDRVPLLESNRPHAGHLARLRAWAASLPLQPGMRWANEYRWPVPGPDHDEAFDALYTLDVPTFRGGYIPASTYRLDVAGSSAELYRVVNVRYVLSNESKGDGFRELARFGPFVVSEVEAPRSEPFQVIAGAGDVRLVKATDEEVVLDAAPGSSGLLRLGISWFPRWRAERDGRPLEITETPLEGVPGTGFMVVPLAPGRYRFRYRDAPADVLGGAATLLGLLLVVILALADRVVRLGRLHVWQGWLGTIPDVWRRLALGSVGLACVGIAIGAVLPRRQPALDVVRDLAFADVTRGGETCSYRAGAVTCEGGVTIGADAVQLLGGEVLPCVSVHLDGSPVTLRWPSRAVRRVRGALGPRRGAADVSVLVRVAGRVVAEAQGTWSRRFGGRIEPAEGPVEVEIQGSGHACVAVRLIGP